MHWNYDLAKNPVLKKCLIFTNEDNVYVLIGRHWRVEGGGGTSLQIRRREKRLLARVLGVLWHFLSSFLLNKGSRHFFFPPRPPPLSADHLILLFCFIA